MLAAHLVYRVLQPESYYHDFLNIYVHYINFAFTNAQFKNCYRKATPINVNDNL
jgi:hypothetical protein